MFIFLNIKGLYSNSIAKISEEEYNKNVWKRLFITNDMDSLKGVDEIMDKVVEKIIDYNSDQAIREQLRAEEEWRRARGEEIRVSKEEGIAEAKLSMAKKMKEKGYALEDIVELTNLSIEEIKKL